MIRVNLLRSRTTASTEGIYAAPNLESLAAKNIAILLVLTALLYAYEYQNIANLRKEIKRSNGAVATLKKTLKEQTAAAGEAKELSKQLNQVKDRVKVIKNLSRERLIELKSLDLLQSIIPEKVWFEKVNYNSRKFDIQATAVDIDDITLFKTSLDNQSIFKNVVIKDTKEMQTRSGNIVHNFSLVIEVEEKIE